MDKLEKRIFWFRKWVLLLSMIIPIALFVFAEQARMANEYHRWETIEMAYLVFGVPIAVFNAIVWATPDDFVAFVKFYMMSDAKSDQPGDDWSI